MKRTSCLVTATLLIAIMAVGCGDRSPSATPVPVASSPASEPTAAELDREWVEAINGDDAAAVETLLDRDFEWTDTDGRTRNRVESIEAVATLKANLGGEADVRAYRYGHVTAITSARPGARLMRVWVMRPEGWRAFAMISTALTTGTTPFAAAGNGATSDCENPCRTMPFTPKTENEEAIADIFRQLKVDEWHPNPERWSRYVLDDVYYVTATAQLSKADRVARLVTLKTTGAPSVPGDPVVSMRIVDLGDSAVMMARHTPFHRGTPYYSVRVWALRDGRWQLANTQQTAIADAPEAIAGP